jgi:hypothetical protein
VKLTLEITASARIAFHKHGSSVLALNVSCIIFLKAIGFFNSLASYFANFLVPKPNFEADNAYPAIQPLTAHSVK